MISDCQDGIREVVQTYGTAILAIAAWSIVALCLHCCCLSLDGSPGLAAQYFGVVGGVQLGMVVFTVTIFFPVCPEACGGQCHDDELGWFYLVPAVEGMVAVAWLRSSWNRAVIARALRRSSVGNSSSGHGMGSSGLAGGHVAEEVAIFSKIPASEADATELELTERSETEDYAEDDHPVVVRAM